MNITLPKIVINKNEDERENWNEMKEKFINFIVYKGSVKEIIGFTCALCFGPLCENKLNYRNH